MEDQWLSWAKRIEALASTGLHFGTSDFDQERYAELALIARQMLADLGRVPLSQLKDLEVQQGQGCATPQVDVRGAVFAGDQILLVQERGDKLWTLPGGYADVGLSAAENVVKEISEEAGLTVRADHLYAVRHKAKHAYRPDTRDFYKFFFICTPLDQAVPVAGLETLDAAFFDLEALPPLSSGRVILRDIVAAFEQRRANPRTTLFD